LGKNSTKIYMRIWRIFGQIAIEWIEKPGEVDGTVAEWSGEKEYGQSIEGNANNPIGTPIAL
jgi:hypothetical protein